VHTGSHASLAAQDFAASRGLLSSEKEVVAIQAPPSPLVIVFPAPAPGDDQTVNEVMSLSPYHGSTMTLHIHINPSVISTLDLNLDLVYLHILDSLL
jgi:hypothetical protein